MSNGNGIKIENILRGLVFIAVLIFLLPNVFSVGEDLSSIPVYEEEKGFLIDISLTIDVEEVYNEEYEIMLPEVVDIEIFSIKMQKNNFGVFYSDNDLNQDDSINPKITLYKNNLPVWEGYIALFGFDENITDKLTNIEILAPYKNADKIQVIFNGEVKFEAGIPERICNQNGQCDENEDIFSCMDCKPYDRDGVCIVKDDGMCDVDCDSWMDDDCEDLDFCSNGMWNYYEESIDCGDICNIDCIYDLNQLFKILRSYDRKELHLLEASALIGDFQYTTFI